MSQPNNEMTGMVMVFAVIAAAFYIVILAVVAIATFLAFVMTIIALFAWNKPRKIGKHVLMPHEARAFVYRGLAGAFVIPLFWIFCCALFELPFHGEFFHFVTLGGYVLGSVGITVLEEDDDVPKQQIIHEALPQKSSEPPTLPAPQKEKFRYASWDDEEERRA